MKNKTLTFLMLFSTFVLTAQTNLVINGSFEKLDKKVKSPGQIELATGWSSPTDNKADLFVKDSKSEEINAENNIYGGQSPDDGEVYAGFVAYSYKEAQPRTYLQGKLSKPLEAGKSYCVKMFLTLGDLSKFGVNNIGIYLSKNPVSNKDLTTYAIEPQVHHSQNRIFKESQIWESICQIYQAEGGEQYITIGNFKKYEDTKFEKVKRPRGFTSPQKPIAYFFIDNVSVISLDSLSPSECVCEKQNIQRESKVVYHQDISIEEEEVKAADKIELIQIFYDRNQVNPKEDQLTKIDEIAELLKSNPSLKVEIQGHSDNVEKTKLSEDISIKRAKIIQQKLTEKGVSSGQITVKGYQDTAPANKSGTPEAMAQNRRVSFKVIK
jgi:outer membrane protein OmpA-like peptidoglycan-associated protein